MVSFIDGRFRVRRRDRHEETNEKEGRKKRHGSREQGSCFRFDRGPIEENEVARLLLLAMFGSALRGAKTKEVKTLATSGESCE